LSAKANDRDAFMTLVMAPLQRVADTTIDRPSILRGLFLPGSVGERVGDAYDRHLLHDATLSDLPETPHFVFCATNVQTGSLVRFNRRGVRDWRVGAFAAPGLARSLPHRPFRLFSLRSNSTCAHIRWLPTPEIWSMPASTGRSSF
jgi:hypothetical protein